jgi:hypothetical protein
MAPLNAYMSNMHRVPTYDEIVDEATIHPIDKIKLPDRQATFIRNLPQMTRFDEVDDPADIGKEQDLIQQERQKQISLQRLPLGKTLSLERARDTRRQVDADYLRRGGPRPPPSIAVPASQIGLTNPQRPSLLGQAASLVGGATLNVLTLPFAALHAFNESADAQAAAAEEERQNNTGHQFRQAQDEQESNMAQAAERAIRSSTRQAWDSLTTPHSTVEVPDDYDTGGPSASASSSSGAARQSSSAARAREAPRPQPTPTPTPTPTPLPAPARGPQMISIADTDPPTPPAHTAAGSTYDIRQYEPLRRERAGRLARAFGGQGYNYRTAG